MRQVHRATFILLGFLLLCRPLFAQFSTCDSNLVNAHLNPAGYVRLFVPTQPCSMYYHSTTVKYGIDGHRDAANLGVPQVVIESAQENTDVSAALFAQGVYSIAGTNAAVWLGITDSSTTYTWRTISTGVPATYFNWAASEPNNLAPGCQVGASCAFCFGADAYWCQYGEDCAIMNAGGQWLDNTCQGTNVKRVVVLELNTCPVITKPHDTILCAGNPVNLNTSVIKGGTAPYTYTWNPGGYTGSSVTITPASSATYTVEASDHYLCKTDSTFTISVNSVTTPTIIASPTTVCKNVNDNISLSTVSGTATYTWSFGAGANLVSGTGGGAHVVNWSIGGVKNISVTVTDNGCTTTATTTVTVDSANGAFLVNPTSACTGQNVTATVTTVSATATYTWSFGGGTAVSGTGAGPYTIDWATPGIKTVGLTVTDNGCQAITSSTVNIGTGPSAAFILNPTSACPGQNVTATVTTVSATATYTWSWGGGTVVSGTGAGPYTVDWATSGTKTVGLTVTDNGCSAVSSSTINIASTSAAFTLNPTSVCTSQNVTATVTTVSGTATYAWSFGGATVVSGTGAGPYTLDWATTGTKTVGLTVTDNGCTVNSSATETVGNPPSAAFTLNPTSTCINNNVTATVTTTSPTATYTWSWGGGTVVSGTGSGPYTVDWATPGTKTVDLTVTDNGCTSTSSSTIVITNGANAAFTLSPTSACLNQNVTATVTAVSATATYTWSWGGGTVASGTGAGPYTINWSTAGTKTVGLTVTDNGCQATSSSTVTINNPTPSTFTINPSATCQGSNVTVTLNGAASGTATYTWNFNGGNVVSGTGAGPYTVNWSTTGTQTVDLTVTDNGCTSNTTNTVAVSNSLSPTFTLNPTTACINDPVTVTLTSGTSGTATYNWNFNGGTVISGSGAGPYSVSWSTNGPQNVDLTVTDGGCSGTATQSVTIANSATSDAGADIQICPGATGNLGTTPTAGYSYSWSPATGLSSASISNPTITIPSNPTGSNINAAYVVTTTSGSCSATDTVIVTIYPDVSTSFTVSPSGVCTGDNVTVTYSGTVSATANYTWNFSGANVVSGSGAGPYVVNWSSAGGETITLDVTDNGCTGTQSSQNVAVGLKPTAVAGPDQTICSGGSVQLGTTAVSGVTYSWTPAAHLSNANISDPVFSEIDTNAFPDIIPYMLVADGGGCQDTSYVTVTVNATLPIHIYLNGFSSLCSGDSVILLDTITGQTNYMWSTGETTSSIIVKTSGIFSVTAHDANGCIYVSQPSEQVYAYTNPMLSLAVNGQTNESCTGANDGSLVVIATNGTPAYAYEWNTVPPQNGPMATSLDPGNYTVTVYDHNGCVDSATFTVLPAPFIGIRIDSMKNISCYGKTDGAIYAGVTGGNPPMSYLWSTGAVTQSITGLSADTFSVTATDSRGCIVDTSVIITDPGPITFTPMSDLHIVYGGHEQIDISISPSSNNYTYSWSPGAALSCVTCPSPVASPLQTTTYYLTVTDPIGGCTAIDTITLNVDPSKSFYIPNAFTPNGDGINDTYMVYASGPVKFFEIEIFDRWGEKVYESNDMGSGWDGKYNGTAASNGVYVYQVTITFLDEQTLANRGTLTLLK